MHVATSIFVLEQTRNMLGTKNNNNFSQINNFFPQREHWRRNCYNIVKNITYIKRSYIVASCLAGEREIGVTRPNFERVRYFLVHLDVVQAGRILADFVGQVLRTPPRPYGKT